MDFCERYMLPLNGPIGSAIAAGVSKDLFLYEIEWPCPSRRRTHWALISKANNPLKHCDIVAVSQVPRSEILEFS